MKNRFATLLVLALLVSLGSGCCCNPNQEFVKTVDSNTQIILPQYKAYIAEDSNLNADSKRIRIQAADELQALIDQAKKEE